MLTIAAGCTSAPTHDMAKAPVEVLSRAPVSAATAELQTVFLRLLSSEHPEEGLKLKLEQISFAYFYALNALAQFDKLLQKDIQTAHSNEEFQRHVIDLRISSRLAAAEAFSSLASEQLLYDVQQLIAIRQAEQSDPRQKVVAEKALQDLSHLLEDLTSVDPAKRVALNFWAESFAASLPESKLTKNFSELFFVQEPEALQDFLQKPALIENQRNLRRQARRSRDARLESMVVSFDQYQRAQLDDQFHTSQTVGRKHSASSIGSRSLASVPVQEGRAVTEKNLAPNGVALAYSGRLHPLYTVWVSEMLKAAHAPASFFISAIDLPTPATPLPMVQKLLQAGFSIQSQGLTPVEMPKLSDAELEKDISQATIQIARQTSQPPGFLLAPFGADSARVVKSLALHQLKLIRPNIEAFDWVDHDVNRITSRVLIQTKAARAGIVSLRMDLSYSALIAKRVANELQSPGMGKNLIALPAGGSVAKQD